MLQADAPHGRRGGALWQPIVICCYPRMSGLLKTRFPPWQKQGRVAGRFEPLLHVQSTTHLSSIDLKEMNKTSTHLDLCRIHLQHLMSNSHPQPLRIQIQPGRQKVIHNTEQRRRPLQNRNNHQRIKIHKKTTSDE